MTAKEFLSQAYLMEMQIRSKQDQIRTYREMLTDLNTHLGDEPVKHTRNVEIIQETILKIMAEEEKLNLQIDELVDKKAGNLRGDPAGPQRRLPPDPGKAVSEFPDVGGDLRGSALFQPHGAAPAQQGDGHCARDHRYGRVN